MKYFIINNSRFDDSEFAFGEQLPGFRTGNAVRCEECGSFLTNLKWLPPYEIKVSKKISGDFIFGTHHGIIVSENFKNKYELSGLKGLSDFNPVKIYFKGQLLNLNYYYPEIMLSEVKTDIKKSGLEFEGRNICNTCQRAGRMITKMKGLIFKPGEITEDIFYTKILSGTIVVSESFRDFILQNGFVNLNLVETNNFKPDWLY